MLALMVGMGTVLAACEGAHWANLATLGVTFCLFFGTLNLGRRATPATPSARIETVEVATQNVPLAK